MLNYISGFETELLLEDIVQTWLTKSTTPAVTPPWEGVCWRREDRRSSPFLAVPKFTWKKTQNTIYNFRISIILTHVKSVVGI